MDVIVDVKRHAYDKLVVLEDITLHLRAGEIVSMLGPSGCGKSTLLGIVGGLLKPTEGQVLMQGEPQPNCLNPLTFVFQDFALLPWRTVAGNVSFALEHHALGRGEINERVADALHRTGLTEFSDALPKRLSGGMRQRVGIARALVVRPAVLLMDEPFSALDAQTRELLMEDFLSLWERERIAALYVTHNFAEALRMADRIMVLSRRPGRIKEMVEVPIPQSERGSVAAQMVARQTGQSSLVADPCRSFVRGT